MSRRPLAVAVTGGIAAGKSEALAAFGRHGAATLSADALVHDLLAHDEEVRAAIRDRWGDEAVGDRRRIGEIVFRDRDELEWLERLLHPKTRAATDAWLATVEEATPTTPRMGKPKSPNRQNALPVTVRTRAVMLTSMGSRAWPHARRMLAWPMLNAMKNESPP